MNKLINSAITILIACCITPACNPISTLTPTKVNIQDINLADYLILSDFEPVDSQYNGIPNPKILDDGFSIEEGLKDYAAGSPLLINKDYLNYDYGFPVRIFTQEMKKLNSKRITGYLAILIYDTDEKAADAYSKFFNTICFKGYDWIEGESKSVTRGAECGSNWSSYSTFLKCNFIVEIYSNYSGFNELSSFLYEDLIPRLDNLCSIQ